MSLSISYFLAKPYYFKDREKLSAVKSDLVSCTVDSENVVSVIKLLQNTSKSGKLYTNFIELDTVDRITTTTRIRVHCDCANFKFQCESLLAQYDSLYGKPEDSRLPKNQTKPYICKHLYASLILITRLNSIKSLNAIIGD